jgi:hypothetical protein
VLYRLVIHHRPGPELVRVFLPFTPRTDGPEGTPAIMHQLHPPTGRRFLGRSVRDRRAYREFRSEVELLVAGFEPAGPHRVCDSWDDYLNPWGSHSMSDQETDRIELTDEEEVVSER